MKKKGLNKNEVENDKSIDSKRVNIEGDETNE